MTKLYMVTDDKGNTLADNLRGDYAQGVAETIAQFTGGTVTVYDRSAAASDEGQEVHPPRPHTGLEPLGVTEEGYQAGLKRALGLPGLPTMRGRNAARRARSW